MSNLAESNLKNEVFRTIYKKNQNLIKQGFLLLEICQNAAGSTDHAMERRGHDGPSWAPSPHTWVQFFCCFLHSPRRQV